MALATAKLFVEEGAYVFITGRRQDRLDEAVKAISKNVTGVLSDASNLSDLDRLYEIVKKEKGKIDVLFASAGYAEFAAIGEVTEEHFEKIIGLNIKGTLFTVQKALPLFNDGGSILTLEQLRLRHWREAESVKRAGAVLVQCRKMLGRGVALVPPESVLRIKRIQFGHDPVASDLCDHAGCRDGEAQAVAPNDGCVRRGEVAHRQPVD